MGAMTFDQYVSKIYETIGDVGIIPYEEAVLHNLRAAVAGELHSRLIETIIKRRPHLSSWQTDRALIYTHAHPADFAAAVDQFNDDFNASIPFYDRVARWNDIPVYRNGTGLHLDLGGLIFPILSVKHYTGAPGRWRIRLTDFGGRLLSGRPEAPTRKYAPTVYVRSEQSADYTLSRMAAAFFGLDLGGAN